MSNNKRLEELGRERRAEICRFIRATQKEWGVSPSIQEIADHLGVKPFAVRRHIGILVEEGKVTYLKGVARSLRVIPPNRRAS